MVNEDEFHDIEISNYAIRKVQVNSSIDEALSALNIDSIYKEELSLYICKVYVKGVISILPLYIKIYPDDLLLFKVVLPFRIRGKKIRKRIDRFISGANSDLVKGCFQITSGEGEISFRNHMNIFQPAGILKEEIICEIQYLIIELQRYEEGIIRLSFLSNSTFKKELKKCESGEVFLDTMGMSEYIQDPFPLKNENDIPMEIPKNIDNELPFTL